MTLSKPQIIALAACHQCGSMRGEQCRFTRAEDPHSLRTVAKQSHLVRMQLAREIFARPLDLSRIKL